MNKEEQFKYIEENIPLQITRNAHRAVRHNFFKDINTELQAYLLGFFAADGGLDEKRKTFRVQLESRDSEIVNLYKDAICPEARMFYVPEKNVLGRHGEIYTRKPCYGIDINSTILVTSLVELGYGY